MVRHSIVTCAVLSALAGNSAHSQSLCEADILLYEGPLANHDSVKFGRELAVDGNYAIISAPWVQDSDGRVFIYERNELGWNRVATFAPTSTIDAQLGNEVAIGGTVAIASDSVRFMNLNVPIIRVYERANGIWTETAQVPFPPEMTAGGYYLLDTEPLAVHGDRFVLGRPEAIGNGNSGAPNGIVHVFYRHGVGDWRLEQSLSAPDGNMVSQGYAVLLRDELLVFQSRLGALVMYRLENGAWIYDQTITTGGWATGQIELVDDVLYVGVDSPGSPPAVIEFIATLASHGSRSANSTVPMTRQTSPTNSSCRARSSPPQQAYRAPRSPPIGWTVPESQARPSCSQAISCTPLRSANPLPSAVTHCSPAHPTGCRIRALSTIRLALWLNFAALYPATVTVTASPTPANSSRASALM